MLNTSNIIYLTMPYTFLYLTVSYTFLSYSIICLPI